MLSRSACEDFVVADGRPHWRASKLVGGRTDPKGAWAHGRLEVFDGNSFPTIYDSSTQVGRRAAGVACRSLAFASGAQMVSGLASGLAGGDGMADYISRVECEGIEDTIWNHTGTTCIVLTTIQSP